MRRSRPIVIILIAFTAVTLCNPTFAQEPKKPWTGTLKDGTKINEEDLKKILSDHQKWLKQEKGGKQADLSGADLSGADLSGAILRIANFEKAILYKVDLSSAKLIGANFQSADLQSASLFMSNLKGASLRGANLQKAFLMGANLQGAELNVANLQGANLWGANLEGTVFEIRLNNLPDITYIAGAFNLSSLQYQQSPHALVELRAEFKKYGLRRQEREITYAIKHSGYLKAMSWRDLSTKFQVIFGHIFFEWTCQWGMSPLRPLLILWIFVCIFSPLYMLSLKKQKKKNGIWKFWIKERARKDLGSDEPELLTCNWLGTLGYGIYFSILSAFHVGWRDLNVGTWIARMQPREYRLQATGWVRFFSGVQSLLSVYLLALTILVYFGRPFESY